MRKIIALLLCLVMTCGMLVACGDPEIGKHADELKDKFYVKPEQKISLKLYMVYDEADAGALQEVERRINAMTEADYNTKLDVVYCTAGEYDEKVLAAADAGENAIVLINSEALMMELYEKGAVQELTDYILPKSNGEDAKYGLLNAKIASSLIGASKIEDKLFSIPNNHLIDGEEGYTYLKLDRKACEIWLNHNAEYLRGIDTPDEIADLKAELEKLKVPADEIAEYVQEVRGSYATKAAIEKGEKFIANVIVSPTATAEDAFSGAFAVLKGTDDPKTPDLLENDADRAMRIIYAINMDSAFHNLLLYGIKDTNYQLKDGVVTRFDTENKKYYINILYAGNVFHALYCEAEGWTAEVAAYAENQNKEADAKFAAGN